MKFENKVAIITGSTRGIGRATAELFAKEGAKVIVVGTKEELGESCVNEIKAAGGEAIFCKTDVTSDESLDNLVKTALDAYGKIDILVNNAGVGGTTANMDQITMDEWNTVLATNLTAPFVLCKKLIPIMEKQGAGTIVNVASMAATAAGRGGLAYTSAKHGLLGLTRQMSLDHGRTGVRINAVLPGPIATDMIARVLVKVFKTSKSVFRPCFHINPVVQYVYKHKGGFDYHEEKKVFQITILNADYHDYCYVLPASPSSFR